ncbi:unnamed protein product, partial [Candidula unifasciata]
VQAALGLLLAAAGNGVAYEEINRVAFLNPPVPVNVDFKTLLLQWSNLTEVQLYSANGIFVNPNFPIERGFVEAVLFYYFAQSTNFDFSYPGGPEKPINDFVERQTNHLIKDLLPAHTITGSTAVILVNTVFFNGTWERTFDHRSTNKGDFYTLDKGTVQVDMMRSSRKINIRRNVFGADVIELTYHGNFALYIALPQAVNGIIQLETHLNTPGAVNQLFEGFKKEYLQLSLPKFRIESDFKLKVPLYQIGIRTVFTDNANLHGISKTGGLFVSEIFHKAVIEVQEAGTVAGAATAIEINLLSAKIQYPEFKVDHPFIFFLRDRQTNIILFQGKFSG